MKYLKYVYSPETGIEPDAPGLKFGFQNESEFPTSTPIMFGTADSVDPETPGVLAVLTKAQYEQAQADELAARAAKETERWAGQIADRRYEAETRGIQVEGMAVATDDRSKLLINGAAVEAMLDPEYVMRWKAGSGFVDLTAQQVIAVARAVRAHVQACFDREAELLQAVADGSFEPEMLEQGWPA